MIGSLAPTLSPNQVRVALKNSNKAMKASRLAAILATRGMADEAPEAAASTKFFSGLEVNFKKLIENFNEKKRK